MDTAAGPNAILLGKLTRQTLINAHQQAFIDQAGGNLLYAATGATLWGTATGLVARVGADYPGRWLETVAEHGFDIQGIRRLPDEADLRHFIAYRAINEAIYENPIRVFGELGLPVPKSLIGYQAPKAGLDSRKTRGALTLRAEDIPLSYDGAQAAHLCPLDYLSHSILPSVLRQRGVGRVSLAASSSYMHPDFWNDLPALVNGLSAFVSTEAQMRTFFSGRSHDLWAMAEGLARHNCGAVVILREEKGSLLFDAEAGVRYQIPPYPARVYDITGAADAFGGGLLAGLQAEADPLRAALQGAVSLSLAVEGSGPFYALETTPDLARSRADALERVVKII